jgi:phospholipid/cholesterol/gamma-HCH transport system substrate-binding protein
MKTTRNAIAVGFVTVIVAVGLYFTIRTIAGSRAGDEQYAVWGLFPDASGLVVRSRVMMAGIPVGHIRSIGLQPFEVDAGADDGGTPASQTIMGAKVVISVNGDVPLYADARALRVVGSIVTGDYIIVLAPGDPKEQRLKDGDRIIAVSEAGVFGQIGDIAGDIKQVTYNLKQVFGSEKGGQQMSEVLANLRDISVSINRLLEQNQEAVTRTLQNVDGIAAENRPNLKQVVEDMRHITETLREFVEANKESATGAVASADAAMKDIRGTVAKLDKVLDDLGQVTAGVAEGEGTVGRLLTDDQLIDDVETVVDDVKGLLGGVTSLKTIVGLAGEFNFYDNTLKTTLQLRLQPREDKYYLIEAIYDPRGATSRKEIVVESTDPSQPAQYREVQRITRDSLLFSLMFARRLGFATFRFGIKESAGGVGLDLHLLHDRIELSTDIYRFGDDVYPRLKPMVAVEFLRHLFIIGGINDVLNDSRDYFIGMMIRFNDEDLKTILAFSPSVPAS